MKGKTPLTRTVVGEMSAPDKVDAYPQCPDCAGALSMPTRLGAGIHNCQCEECGKAYFLGDLLKSSQS